MDRNQAKEFYPILQAFADGKAIERKLQGTWIEIKSLNIEGSPSDYRIKPKSEDKYRPFANVVECWQEMQKHQPFGWVKLKGTESGYYMLKGIASQVVIGLNENPFSYMKVFKYYTFADGLPFGVKVEE